MKKILYSILIVLAIAIPATAATYAYFSSQGKILGNEVTTGILKILVNGEPTAVGMHVDNLAPGIPSHSAEYTILNGGGSNLTAKFLGLSYANPNDWGNGLWQVAKVKVDVQYGMSPWTSRYNGLIKNLPADLSLLFPGFDLDPGQHMHIKFTPYIEETHTDQSALMNKPLQWDFVLEGRTL